MDPEQNGDESAKPAASGDDKTKPQPKTTRARGNGSGQGPGWGGPAKGAAKNPKPKAPPFVGIPGPGRGKFTIAGEAKKEQTYRRVETLMQILWDISNNEKEITAQRVQATNHLLNRIQGLPVQTVVTAAADDLSMKTDAELVDDVERRGGKIRAFREAVMGSNLPEGPSGVDDRGAGPGGAPAGEAPSRTDPAA